MSYKFSLVARDIIKEKYYYDISEDEICYLAIYFETFFSKIVVEKNNINILLVTQAGPAYIKLMENDLKSNISNLNLTITDSYQENSSEYDFIISTILDKYETNVPVIYQNEILDYEYIKREIYLYNYMGKINIPVMKGMESILLSSISRETFYICDARKSYHENIKDMIERLINSGLVDDGFLYRMREREKKSSMIFTDKIAFPHTDNELNTRFLISIGISENGFKDNKDLKIILLAAIPSNKDNSLILTKTYEELISLARNDEVLSHIVKIKDYKELINYFIKNINIYKY